MLEIDLTELHAHTIMGAIALCYSEGTSDIDRDFLAKHDMEQRMNAEFEIVQAINIQYPKVVQAYSWLPPVKRLANQ